LKLAVCGCSWSSRDKIHPNIEFGQFIADYFDAEYHNLAIEGMSNFGIRLQIDYAIDVLKADFVIINATTATRVDLKLPSDEYQIVDAIAKPIGEFQRYDHRQGWDNIDKTFIADSLGSIFDEDLDKSFNNNHRVTHLSKVFNEKNHTVFKQHFLNFYDSDIERHKQYYILQSGLDRLTKTNTQFVFSPNTFEWAEGMTMSNSLLEYSLEPFKWDIPDENILNPGISETLHTCDNVYGSWENSPGTEMSNHLPIESHIEYGQQVIKHIKANKLDK
jgi:hypothetical protein|tara:strand:- start:5786 stop:6610 length:825 start_codon:yes stop_codon:yes gene_type:complete